MKSVQKSKFLTFAVTLALFSGCAAIHGDDDADLIEAEIRSLLAETGEEVKPAPALAKETTPVVSIPKALTAKTKTPSPAKLEVKKTLPKSEPKLAVAEPAVIQAEIEKAELAEIEKRADSLIKQAKGVEESLADLEKVENAKLESEGAELYESIFGAKEAADQKLALAGEIKAKAKEKMDVVEVAAEEKVDALARLAEVDEASDKEESNESQDVAGESEEEAVVKLEEGVEEALTNNEEETEKASLLVADNGDGSGDGSGEGDAETVSDSQDGADARAMLAEPSALQQSGENIAQSLTSSFDATGTEPGKIPLWVFLLMAVALAVAGFSLMWVSRQEPAAVPKTNKK